MNENPLLYIIFALIIFQNNSYSEQLKYDTEIIINMDKNDYILRERITLEIKVLNYDIKGPKIGRFTDVLEKLYLQKSSGEIYPFQFTISYSDDIPHMSPGDSLIDQVDLLMSYGVLQNLKNDFILPVGDYETKLVWYERDNHAPIISNTIKFTIHEPDENEKKEQNLFLKFLENVSYHKDRYDSTAIKMNEYYDILINQFPHSAYIERALVFKFLVNTNNRKFSSNLLKLSSETCFEFLNYFPKEISFLTIDPIFEYYQSIDDFDKGISRLHEMYQSKEISKYITILDSEIEKYNKRKKINN